MTKGCVDHSEETSEDLGLSGEGLQRLIEDLGLSLKLGQQFETRGDHMTVSHVSSDI